MKLKLKPHSLCIAILFALFGAGKIAYSVEFNTDILDAEDKKNIDFSRFATANYILPGDYLLTLMINNHQLADFTIPFYARDGKKDSIEACLSPEMVERLGLTISAQDKITYWHDNACADLSALSGATVSGDLSNAALRISIPQALLEYTDPNWVPASQWDNGIPGLLLDYNVNSAVTWLQGDDQMKNASVSGTTGTNIGSWRLRGDYQGSYTSASRGQDSQRNFAWSRMYAFRALPQMGATLTLGENFINSNLFDSWRYTGVGIASDERMLPPSLRGYAPEVSGIARTNARVIISQQGRVLYETTVASGPFRIQSLSSAVNGRLDVRVEEQDGNTQTFQVDTATIPYLTRPGQVRYTTAFGRPSTYDHGIEGPMFANGDFSWGVANSWSLYGGGTFAGDYNAVAIGLGRDLYNFGALSADVTQSWARIPGQDSRVGKSWRLSYSKRFDEINGEVTFAGYRFSEREFMSMGQYLESRYHDGSVGQDKELYTITANKSFEDASVTAYLSYSHQTYWDQPYNDRYNISISRYFDFASLKNLAVSLSATRSKFNGQKNDTLFLSMSLPMGNGTLSYSGQTNNSRYSHSLGYYGRIDNRNSYRLTGGTSSGGGNGTNGQVSGYFSHRGDFSDMSVNASYVQNSFTSLGLSLQGGATVTGKGAALHPGGGNGNTRLLVDTGGVGNVPVEGGRVRTNRWGIGVVTDMSSYYLTSTSIDVNQLDDDVEASKSVVESSLTEGAIGYRQFSLLKGAKVLAILALSDGSHPPFGASVMNRKGQELAVLSDGGLAYLSGISFGEQLDVVWNGQKQCYVEIPKSLPPLAQLLLPCHSMN
ncbi:fimbria/pilus outer membrane usher protein [Serratia aquatilis]|uniref:Fimbria/pilus outer membrane usher protein n=1 Tax=Serratia aquatilis TaxID=1737515 RepID=A0ABV6E9W4_9GAMM